MNSDNNDKETRFCVCLKTAFGFTVGVIYFFKELENSYYRVEVPDKYISFTKSTFDQLFVPV